MKATATAGAAAPGWPPAWGVSHARPLADTDGSRLWRVLWRGASGAAQPAVIKALKPAPGVHDELRGALYLRWRDGAGAVRLRDQQGLWLLLEDGGTRTLQDETDDAAMTVAADLLGRLRQPVAQAAPAGLQPLGERFAALFERCGAARVPDAAYLAAAAARTLLDAPHASVPLHGDLHHGNVVHGVRGWLAIDPKGVLGDAAFDAANWFYNPWGRDALHQQPARIAALARALAPPLGCTPAHVLRHAVAYGGLSAAWFAQDGAPADEQRTLAKVAALQAALAAWPV